MVQLHHLCHFFCPFASPFRLSFFPDCARRYGDWNSVSPTDGLYIANVLYMRNNLIMASIATAVGAGGDAPIFVARAASIRDAVHAAYFNVSAGFWSTGSQTAQAMALVFALDGNASAPALAQLVADVRARGNHISGGMFGSRYLLEALSMYGRGDVALDVATVPTAPSWLAMALGTPEQPSLGTLWESWAGPIANGDSGNHPFLGGGIGVRNASSFFSCT